MFSELTEWDADQNRPVSAGLDRGSKRYSNSHGMFKGMLHHIYKKSTFTARQRLTVKMGFGLKEGRNRSRKVSPYEHFKAPSVFFDSFLKSFFVVLYFYFLLFSHLFFKEICDLVKLGSE